MMYQSARIWRIWHEFDELMQLAVIVPNSLHFIVSIGHFPQYGAAPVQPVRSHVNALKHRQTKAKLPDLQSVKIEGNVAVPRVKAEEKKKAEKARQNERNPVTMPPRFSSAQ